VRLLHVVPTYLPATRYGGPIYSVHQLCAALVGLGHDVHVFTTNVDGPGVSNVPLLEPVERDGVKIWYFPAGYGKRLYRAPKMRSALRRVVKTFDLLHLHSVFLWPTTVAAQEARRANVPYLIAPRGMLVQELISRKSSVAKRAWIAAFERRNLKYACAVHVTSQAEATEFNRLASNFLDSLRCQTGYHLRMPRLLAEVVV
jgi:glycosyltransferase involved in cell wall biosynthesis